MGSKEEKTMCVSNSPDRDLERKRQTGLLLRGMCDPRTLLFSMENTATCLHFDGDDLGKRRH